MSFFLGIVYLVLTCFLFSAPAHAEDVSTKPAAFVWYEELAAQGDLDAKFSLGMMCETGWGVPVDLKLANRWYREAAKEGHGEAQLRLGMMYYLGLGGNQSQLKGESWIRKSAAQGNKLASSLNEKLLTGETAGTIDTVKVLGDVRKVYLQDEKKALPELERLIQLAKQEIKIKEQAREKSTIRERREERKENQAIVASAGPEKADSEVVTKQPAVIKKPTSDKKKKIERIESVIPEFVDKESVEENRTLAKGNIETIRLQAEKGQASAQYNLGRMYEMGIKLPVDKKQALSWYEKSASQGYPDAEYRLALALLYGINIEKDETQGRKWLASAAKHGHQVAENLMKKISSGERLLKTGQSVVVDWYLEKAIVGDAQSALNLGKIYEHGWGVMPDTREAGKWYKRAVSSGSQEASQLLKQLATGLAQNPAGSQASGPGMISHSALPSNWIAYIIAMLVAGFIFFSPMLLNKQKQKSEFQDLDKNVQHREEPPFR
ncbi:tetratricopeptide repeat protein [Kaarinaea lacus]